MKVPFNARYRLENLRDRVILSRLDYRIQYAKINENIFLKKDRGKYIYMVFAYLTLGLSMLGNGFSWLIISTLKLVKYIFFLPLRLIRRAREGSNKGAAIALGIVVLLSPFIIYFSTFYFLLSGSIDNENKNFLLKLHQYRTAISVRDESNNLLGIMPNSLVVPSEYIDISYEKDMTSGFYKQSHNRESSLYVDEVPDFFWEVLVEREHKELNFSDEDGLLGYIKGVRRRSYRGVDVVAPMLNAIKKVLSKLSIKVEGGEGGGGSTPMNSMIKNLYGNNYFEIIEKKKRKDGKIKTIHHNNTKNLNYECPVIFNFNYKLCRKLTEYRAARDLFPYLAENNGREFKRWVAMHAPFVGSVGANGLYGLQATAAIMFGDRPKQLNRAEQSFIAASYLTDFRFSLLDSVAEHTELEWIKVCKQKYSKLERTERWECRKRIAKKIAHKVLIKKYKGEELAGEQLKLNQEFTQMALPKMPEIPAILRPFFYTEGVSRREKIKKYANLRTRLDAFMPGFKLLVQKELQDFMDRFKKAQPIEVITTLPLGDDYKFRKNIAKKLGIIASNYSFNKKLSLKAAKDERASIRISVAELKTGNIVRYYLQEGRQAVEEKVGRNKYPPLRPIASIAKIPAAMLLIKKGVKAKDQLCNQSYQKKQNAGGDIGVKNCSISFSFEYSIAKSKNLPLRYILNKKTTAEELNSLYKDFALEAKKNEENISAKRHFIENLSFGTARATASHTHRIMNTVSQILVYKGRNYSRALHTIKKIRHVSYSGELQANERSLSRGRKKSKLARISKYLQGTERINTMRTVLSAPVRFGTLSFLGAIERGKVLYGKTGTLDTDAKKKIDKNIKDKYLVGMMDVKGRYYTFSILIGSEKYKGSGLIHKISSKQLMKPLVQEIVDSLFFSS